MEWWPNGPGRGPRQWVCLWCFQELRAGLATTAGAAP